MTFEKKCFEHNLKMVKILSKILKRKSDLFLILLIKLKFKLNICKIWFLIRLFLLQNF